MGFLLQSFQRTRLLLNPKLSRVYSRCFFSTPELKNRKAAAASPDTSSDPGSLHTAVGGARFNFSNPDDDIEVARVHGNCRMSLAEFKKSPEPVASNAMPALPVTYEIGVPQKDNTILFQNSNGDRMNQHEITGEQYAYSSFRNIVLYYPGCVSADEDENRLFISDMNHHRIIITDGDGKILDCIGSSPGFEDGEFESAQLFRPAASIYDTADNCLYFVDSENNAIRRADMESRIVETMFPVSAPKTSGVWNWILFKLGLAKGADVKSEEFDLDSFLSPWYLLKSGDDDLVIINRSFEMSWIISMETWEIKNVTNGRANILENYRQMIEKKVTLTIGQQLRL